MTTGEKVVTWGLLAYLAWSLSRPSGVAGAGAATANASANVSVTPGWVQQLSASLDQGASFFTSPCGISTLGAP